MDSIAAGFIAGGISPGAAMVFLLAGPATNVASLVVLRAEFGMRFLAAYLVSIVVTSLGLGVLFDVLSGTLRLPAVTPPIHDHEAVSVASLVAVGVFLLMAAASVRRTRALQRGVSRLKRLAGAPAAR